MTIAFDYAEILAQWETLPDCKLRYAADEWGWGKALDEQHICLANCPISPGLRLYDIVTVREDPAGRTVETVVQSYYTQQWSVRYPVGPTEADTVATYRTLHEACKAAGGSLEGMVAGMAVCNAPAAMDVPATIAATGITGVVCERYEEPAVHAQSAWKPYRRKGYTELRPYIPGEDLTGISVSAQDTPQAGGWIARNPQDREDQWYVNAAYVAANMEEVVDVPEPD